MNVPIAGVTERRDAKAKLAREIAYGIEQLRNSAAWHDDVVVDLQQSGCAQRQRELPPDAPHIVAFGLIRGPSDLGGASLAARGLDEAALFGNRRLHPVTLDDDHCL